MKKNYVKPTAVWGSFHVEDDLMADVNLASRPSTEVGWEIPATSSPAGQSFNEDGTIS